MESNASVGGVTNRPVCRGAGRPCRRRECQYCYGRWIAEYRRISEQSTEAPTEAEADPSSHGPTLNQAGDVDKDGELVGALTRRLRRAVCENVAAGFDPDEHVALVAGLLVARGLR